MKVRIKSTQNIVSLEKKGHSATLLCLADGSENTYFQGPLSVLLYGSNPQTVVWLKIDTDDLDPISSYVESHPVCIT